MKRSLLLAILVALSWAATAAHALDLSGTWQGGDDKARYVVKIQKHQNTYVGDLYNLGDKLGDETSGAPRNGNKISHLILTGRAVKFSLDSTGETFEGTVADGDKSMTGTWTRRFRPPQPLQMTRVSPKMAWQIDTSPHKTLFVTVQKGVRLEVLDWGGSGTPLIFLSGLGGTAHEFDRFAPKFTGHHRVYGITRRGYGASSYPPLTDENYDADRLGDDVLAMMDALRIENPVLVGHSIGGEELSSIGTRHPERVSGLIYLEALYSYAFYNPAQDDLALDSAAVRRGLDRIFDLQSHPTQLRALIAEIQATLPNLQKALQEMAEGFADAPEMPDAEPFQERAGNKVFSNQHQYGVSKVPVLAIVAIPRRCEPNCDKPFMQKAMAADAARADLFEKSAPNARVIRLPNASHMIFRSNDAQVEQEMNTFMDGLAR